MIITLLSYKGGVGKTTTAIHLAAYFATVASQYKSIAVVDGDPNQSAIAWSERGDLPYPIYNAKAQRQLRKYEHLVIDSEARPKPADIEALADCDLIILPTTPDAMAVQATMQTVGALEDLDCDNYVILLSKVPPPPQTDAIKARKSMEKAGYPILKSEVRRFKAFEKAALLGVTVDQVKGDRNAALAWRDICAVGEEVLSYVG
jgi:chromosome partitioning protein